MTQESRMTSGVRNDRPRTNRDPQEIARKLALLDEPRIKPLSDFVRRLRAERGGDESIPWFDPTEAGTKARILMLFEAPGRRAIAQQGSGFISPDNNDGSAQNMWELLREAGIDRGREIAAWNVVPWYIGSERRVRAAQDEDIREAREALARLLLLLPELRIVLLFGKPAAKAWERAGVDLPTIKAPHPSPKNLNSRPQYRGAILRALVEARHRVSGDYPSSTLRRAGVEASDASQNPLTAESKRPAPLAQTRQKDLQNSPRPQLSREIIRDSLLAGLTPDQICKGSRPIYLAALEEEARLEEELGVFEPTPRNVADLRDRRQLRWERIAVRVFGDPRRVAEIRDLYDAARGVGAAKRSYTGRGRRFPEMDS